MQPEQYLQLAASTSLGDDRRRYRLGAVAIRRDGAIVRSKNATDTQKCPAGHAEIRVLRKAGRGATVFVARTRRNGEWAMSRPCAACARCLLSLSATVYYTVSPGVWAKL